jgi:hypothetical protein
MSVFVHGCGVVSAAGVGLTPLLTALTEHKTLLRSDAPLSAVFSGQLAAELDELPAPMSRVEARARRMMSRGAALAAVAAADLVATGDAAALPADELEEHAFFMGVGPSGGDLNQIATLLATGQHGATLDLSVLGREGLSAAHPLLGFSLMNNFTLCHTAIAHGLRGPNAAFFSRGGGTWAALEEAVATLDERRAKGAWVGGADAGTHLTTWEETLREVDHARAPGEGAALLRLGTEPSAVRLRRLAPLEGGLPDVAGHLVISVLETERAVSRFGGLSGGAHHFDLCAIIGSCLAAGPALGWAAAYGLLQAGLGSCAAVVAEGVDGEPWLAELEVVR